MQPKKEKALYLLSEAEDRFVHAVLWSASSLSPLTRFTIHDATGRCQNSPNASRSLKSHFLLCNAAPDVSRCWFTITDATKFQASVSFCLLSIIWFSFHHLDLSWSHLDFQKKYVLAPDHCPPQNVQNSNHLSLFAPPLVFSTGLTSFGHSFCHPQWSITNNRVWFSKCICDNNFWAAACPGLVRFPNCHECHFQKQVG